MCESQFSVLSCQHAWLWFECYMSIVFASLWWQSTDYAYHMRQFLKINFVFIYYYISWFLCFLCVMDELYWLLKILPCFDCTFYFRKVDVIRTFAYIIRTHKIRFALWIIRRLLDFCAVLICRNNTTLYISFWNKHLSMVN